MMPYPMPGTKPNRSLRPIRHLINLGKTMAYLVIYLLLSAVGTIFALCLFAKGGRDDVAPEKLMGEIEPVVPIKKYEH